MLCWNNHTCTSILHFFLATIATCLPDAIEGDLSLCQYVYNQHNRSRIWKNNIPIIVKPSRYCFAIFYAEINIMSKECFCFLAAKAISIYQQAYALPLRSAQIWNSSLKNVCDIISLSMLLVRSTKQLLSTNYL